MSKQEIIDAGIDYTMSTRPVCICGDAFGDMREFNRNSAFEAGAKWVLSQLKNIDESQIEKVLDEAQELRQSAKGRAETGGWYWRRWAEWGYRKAMENKYDCN